MPCRLHWFVNINNESGREQGVRVRAVEKREWLSTVEHATKEGNDASSVLGIADIISDLVLMRPMGSKAMPRIQS
jgi:hypothetical protein